MSSEGGRGGKGRGEEGRGRRGEGRRGEEGRGEGRRGEGRRGEVWNKPLGKIWKVFELNSGASVGFGLCSGP